MAKTACVTGASGYLGSHIVKQLLEKGYSVRGTVRDASNGAKYGWINQLAEGTPGRVELYSADLMHNGSFDAVMEGCDLVCHVAASVTLTAKDPMDIVNPAMEGTKNVFNSILKARCAWRVVMTSTIGAIMDFRAPGEKVYTEGDWHQEMSTDNPYMLGKTLAEKHAWRVVQEQKERATREGEQGWSFDLVCLHPSTILGEMLHKSQEGSSVAVVLQMLDGTLPMAPDFRWPIVHVRDVALAHVRALEDESIHGRFILSNKGAMPFIDIASVLNSKYPKSKAPTWVMPTLLLYLAALFNPKLSVEVVKRNAGRPYLFDNARAVQELGIDFITPEQAIIDTAESLMSHDLVPDLH